MASAAQIGAIHSIAKRLGMTEDERRDAIAAAAGGKRSAKLLTAGEAITVIDNLKAIQGGGAKSRELDGKFAPILRALWISGWHLGVVFDRKDKALLSFLGRQTGLSHTRFLRDTKDARRVIEALKGWLAREAGVDWPGTNDILASKAAVHRAQTRRLIACGFALPDEPTERRMTAEELDADIKARGAVLRKALKTRFKAASNG